MKSTGSFFHSDIATFPCLKRFAIDENMQFEFHTEFFKPFQSPESKFSKSNGFAGNFATRNCPG